MRGDRQAALVLSEDDAVATSPTAADRSVWFLVALTPFLLALSTWNPADLSGGFQGVVRRFSLPVTAIEIVIIIYSILSDFSLVAAFRQLPRWSQLALSILVAVALFTAFFVAVEPARSVIRTYAWIVHLLFGFSAWHLFRTRWKALADSTWPWIVVGLALYLLIVAAWVSAVLDQPGFNWERFGLSVTNIRQIGSYSVVGAAAALGIAATEKQTARYWTAVVATSLMLALSYWSGTRGSIVAIAAAVAVGLALLPAMRSWRTVAAFLIGNIGGALLSLLHVPPSHIYGVLRISRTATAAGANEISSDRIHMWTETLGLVLQRPLLGYGESQFSTISPTFGAFNHPHNVMLQVLFQWGGIGFICFFALAGILGWRFVKIVRADGPGLPSAFLVVAGLVALGLYDGAIYYPYPVMMLALGLAFAMAQGTALTRP